jgi:hypothetical protein
MVVSLLWMGPVKVAVSGVAGRVRKRTAISDRTDQEYRHED